MLIVPAGTIAGNGNTVEYTYNPEGIRVRAKVGENNINYVIDPFNQTGYAQVFKEIRPDANVVYVYGHDALAQAKGTSDPNYFIYDGHGSVRHLATSGGAIAESYNYDAYGNAHGFSPANAATALLYCGEMFDNDLQHYYLRARWYNPANGRFNRMDPFAGDNRDPQSLHKYLYADCDPINRTDPTGNISYSELSTTMATETDLRGRDAATSTAIGAKIHLTIWQKIAANLFVNYMLADTLFDLDRLPGWLHIRHFFATRRVLPLTQKEFEGLEEAVRRLQKFTHPNLKLSLHYSRKEEHHWSLIKGLWGNSWVTRKVYLTGWSAKWFLALPQPKPPNAVYIVWPRWKPEGPTLVPPKYGMGGGALQYHLPFGSGGPGTVFGPIPIPEGEFIW